MELLKKNKIIFYLTRSGATLYSSDSLKPIKINFPSEAILNLEIIDEERLREILKSPLSDISKKSKEVVIILGGDMTFEKEIGEDSIINQNKKTEAFLDIIPFEKIVSKVIRTKENVLVIASNREFLELVIDTLKEEDLSPTTIIPISLSGLKISDFEKDFSFGTVLGKLEKARKYSLMDLSANEEKVITYEKPNVKSTHFITLISIFVFLLFILSILVFTQIINSPKKVPSKIRTNKPTATPIPSITATPSATIEQ